MSLTVDTRNIINHKEICYKEKTKEGYPYADTTYYLAFCSMAIGIGTITKKNYHKVYFRHLFLHRVNGTACPITLKDVESHIGLECNVAYETKGRWKNRIVKGVMDSLWYSVIKSEKL